MQNPDLIRVKEQIAHTQRRIKALEKQAEGAKAKALEHATRVASLRNQLDQLQDGESLPTQNASYLLSSIFYLLSPFRHFVFINLSMQPFIFTLVE